MISPLVTIGISCYNASETITRAITSALSQDWPDIEIVIVDDASTDSSVEIIKKLTADNPEVRIIEQQTNTGPAGVRNTILAEAKGEFIAFFDDDDQSLPNRISEQLNCLQSYELEHKTRLVACYASGIRKYNNGYTLELNAIGSRGTEKPNGPMLAEYLLIYRKVKNWFYGSGTPTCSLLVRKSLLEEIGGFDKKLRRVEDVDLAIRLALRGGHFIGTQKQLFIQHATNSSDKSPEKNLEAEQALAIKYKDYLNSIGKFYYARQWPKLRYWHFKNRYGYFLLELAGLLLRYPYSLPRHLLATGPRRLLHERRMKREQTQ
ncbi:MAG: glycosyltransferase family 2 protein [Methyloligellaceae bacterium]